MSAKFAPRMSCCIRIMNKEEEEEEEEKKKKKI